MSSPNVWRAMRSSLTTPPPSARLIRKGWASTRWEPHPLQEEVLLSRARNKVVAAGRRAGKSQVGGHKLVPEAFRAWYELEELRSLRQRREYWIVGPEYSDAEKEFRVIWDALTQLGFDFDHPGSYNNPQSGEMRISLFSERYIVHAKSAKYPSTLVGEGLSGVVFSEAAKLKLSIWDKYIRPTLADFGGWSLFGSTPEGKNWFYDLWMLGQDPARAGEWKSWRFPSWCNPYVFKQGVNEELLQRAIEARRRKHLDGFINAMRMLRNVFGGFYPEGIDPEIWQMFLDQSQEYFNQEVAALFTEYVGRVFKDFDEEVHVTSDDFRPDWETYACADYGFTNPFVWLLVQVDPHHERVHVLDEYYETGRTTGEAAVEIQSRGLAPETIRKFYPDPAEPDRTRELSKLLKLIPHRGGSIPKQDRLEWLRRLLKPRNPHLGYDHPERVPGFTVHRRCTNTIREWNDYRYKETAEQASEKGRSAPEEPMKKDDHTPEALGRLVSGLFGSPYKDLTGARLRRGRLSPPVRNPYATR